MNKFPQVVLSSAAAVVAGTVPTVHAAIDPCVVARVLVYVRGRSGAAMFGTAAKR